MFFVGIGIAMVLDACLHYMKRQDRRILRALGNNKFVAKHLCCYDAPLGFKEDYEEITDAVMLPHPATDSESDYEPYAGAHMLGRNSGVQQLLPLCTLLLTFVVHLSMPHR